MKSHSNHMGKYSHLFSVVTVAFLLNFTMTVFAGQRGDKEIEKFSLSFEEAFIVLKLEDRTFEDVLGDLKKAIQVNNYYYSGLSTIDEGAERVAKIVQGMEVNFQHFKIVRFCNIRRVLALLRANIYAGATLPCRFAVFVKKEGSQVFVVAIRPTLIGKVLGDRALQEATQALEADYLKILETLKAF